MYKFGIWRPESIDRATTAFGTHKPFAYSLLKTSAPADPAAERIFEAVIQTVRLSSGICRTTYRARLSDVDSVVLAILEGIFSPDREFDVHDWGVSDALVATEWAALLFPRYPKIRFTASDLILWLTEAARDHGESLIFEPDGTALQYIKPPFVVSLAHPERRLYPLNVLASWWGSRSAASLKPAISTIFWSSVPDDAVHGQPPWKFRQIPLIHPRALQFAQDHPNFRITRHDAFTRLSSRCHVLRAMNLYNVTVFGREKVRAGLRAAVDSIENGGIFILGRTNEIAARKNDVSIFRKIENQLLVLQRLGAGSELEDLATGI